MASKKAGPDLSKVKDKDGKALSEYVKHEMAFAPVANANPRDLIEHEKDKIYLGRNICRVVCGVCMGVGVALVGTLFGKK